MRSSRLLKCILIILIIPFLAQKSFSQAKDTTVFLFKFSRTDMFSGYGQIQAQSIDSADFIRLIPPYKLTDTLVEVTEYYKNSKLKFTGKAFVRSINNMGDMMFEGPCMEFYLTGKRRSVSNYSGGLKTGPQYYYYPEGKLWMVVNFKPDKWNKSYINEALVDFYDINGNQICKDGNGRAIEYADNYFKVKEGPVKDGKLDGEWTGVVNGRDAAKYSMFFKKDRLVSGVGYDNNGTPHPFKEVHKGARTPLGLAKFTAEFKNRIQLPKQSLITQKQIDSLQIYFIVEPDGSLSHFETVQEVLPDIFESMKIAFEKCPKWEPAKYYGIPLQTQVVLNLWAVESPSSSKFNWSTVKIQQMDLYNGIPLGSLPTMRTGASLY